MRKIALLVMLFLVVALVGVAGCGSVYLTGEALSAAEASTLDARWACEKAATQPDSIAWQKEYLKENFRQWRLFVRAARRDMTWGPVLSNELPDPIRPQD